MARRGMAETAKADRLVWLMKCPVVAAKSWQSHPPSDPFPAAKVVLSLDPLCPRDDPSSLQARFLPPFTMEMAGAEPGERSKELFLEHVQGLCPNVYFLGDKSRVAMEGKVDHKFDLKPHSDNIEEYSRLCRERTNMSMIKNRQIQVIDNDRGVHLRPMLGMVSIISSTAKDKKKTQPVKQLDVKRTRRDKGELEDIMFKLFERQPNWALKQLVQETDQPAQFVKEILNELCVHNKRAANQGTQELKPQYKKSVEDTGAE